MGKLVILAKWYFFLWAGEDPTERQHVHIFRTNSNNTRGAKFWLDDLSLFERGDFSEKEIKQIKGDLTKHVDLIREQVARSLTGDRVKAIRIKK